MAQRRMFSPQIIDTDAFLDMSTSAQCLYFHLGMRADDDGFVGNPKKISRIVGANDDDLKILAAKRFILVFESGVVVIKHWLIHNLIRPDLYQETQYKKEKSLLGLNENGAYTELRAGVSEIKRIESPEWLKRRRGELRTANVPQTARRLGKDREGKDRLGEVRIDKITYNEKDIEMTELLYNLVKKNYPFVKDKTEAEKKKDYEEMNRLNRIDGRTYEQIGIIIKWSQEDDFWKQNIRSVAKLRKQFESLAIKAISQYNQTRGRNYDK